MVYAPIDLDELRGQYVNSSSKQPFQHQVEAFEAFRKTFKLDGTQCPFCCIIGWFNPFSGDKRPHRRFNFQ